jgi:phosphoenolpyruvate-protein kinase (PTS system EI component)
MIPMVTKPSEVYEFLELLESVTSDIDFTDLGKVELGIMIRTPASAVFIDKLLKYLF